jgi:hypothetical protein
VSVTIRIDGQPDVPGDFTVERDTLMHWSVDVPLMLMPGWKGWVTIDVDEMTYVGQAISTRCVLETADRAKANLICAGPLAVLDFPRPVVS